MFSISVATESCRWSATDCEADRLTITTNMLDASVRAIKYPDFESSNLDFVLK
jgi:hypothetical protein